MDHLSEQQLAGLRTKLETEQAELSERIASSTSVVADNLDPGRGDVEDQAAEEAGRFQAKQLLTRDRARLAEVEAALLRVAEGEYGICEESDEPIPFRRLELEPTTRYTVAAQEALEAEGGVADPHADEPIGY